MKLTVGSLFSGIGGIDLACERASMRVAWQCEIDKQCRDVLCHHWPKTRIYDDARSLSYRTPAVDVMVGGFPCQDLSVAGNRAGLAGERSGLWWQFRRLVAELAPRWVIIENVPGLLSSNGGRDMGTVLGSLGQLGYWWSYRVLDAQWFGVPQRRRRVFIVGHSGDRAAPATVLFEPESLCRDHPPMRAEREIVASLTANGVGTCGADDNQGQAGHLLAMGVYPTFSAHEGGTLTQIPPIIHGASVRRLTPLEASRLQGFPDSWLDIPGLSDSAKYRMLGNSVAVPVVEWITRRLAQYEAVAS